MSKSKHHTTNKSFAYVTPMTREGVSDPLLLSQAGREAHYLRRSGPGTRSKNPQRYDKKAKSHDHN